MSSRPESRSEEPQRHFIVGIDLGTSNCAVAFTEPGHGPDAPVSDFEIPQLRRPGEAAAQPLLPSCIYLPGPHELKEESTRLPWPSDPGVIVGEFARWQGARVPGRFVSSAKSWLCHPGVDRSAPILPWGAPADVRRLSPVEASARLLGQMRAAWDAAHPESPLASQEVVITVPASFDEVARSLTVGAARQAGLETFTLLEEPQAAFYDYTAHHRHDLSKALEGINLVLVVDVGGGTSDFTLVQVAASPEGPVMRRIAVGDHLILGGDNMDAALARKAEEKITASGRKFGAAQWGQLVQAARAAKESLLKPGAAAEYSLAITTEGSRLIGGSLSARLSKEEAVTAILDGFFPFCRPDENPTRGSRLALQELGLPYAKDPAVTRHIAAFLRAHAAASFSALGLDPAGPGLPRPDAVLLNGGVFNSPRIAERLLEVLSSWWPSSPPIPLLRHDSLDLAVARGAAYYGLVRHGLGRRITGGAAHALYVGLEKLDADQPMALCVIPRGQEEGETVDLGGKVFQLTLGRPVRFPLYSTTSDRMEKPGDVVPVADDMEQLPPIHSLLKGAAGKSGGVPVHLRASLTEIGTLELWCVAESSREMWRLEFELRGSDSQAEAGATVTESMPPSFAEARIWVDRIFGGKPRAVVGLKGTPPKDVKQLWASLERSLGPRETWRLPVLRELWSVLFAGAGKRRRSADHERIFYQILGYTLRPGFGYPLDGWRCEQCARLFAERVEFHKDKPNWNEFWVFWRRIANGLNEARHEEIWSCLKPHLALRVPPDPPRNLLRPKGVQPEALDEMVRLGAALEHLDPAQKVEFGDWIAARLREAAASGPWAWALGRLGARVPLRGSIHKTVPPGKAGEWIELLLQPQLVETEGALFALAQLARRTGDRVRDLDDQVRSRVIGVFRSEDASPSWVRMVEEVVVLEAADEARALGDTLPVGLSMA